MRRPSRGLLLLDRPQLWRVRPDGSLAVLAGTEGAGCRDGPAAQAQFGIYLDAAAAGDSSIAVADRYNRCLRLLSPGGAVSTLAGSRDVALRNGPLADAAFCLPGAAAVSL